MQINWPNSVCGCLLSLEPWLTSLLFVSQRSEGAAIFLQQSDTSVWEALVFSHMWDYKGQNKEKHGIQPFVHTGYTLSEFYVFHCLFFLPCLIYKNLYITYGIWQRHERLKQASVISFWLQILTTICHQCGGLTLDASAHHSCPITPLCKKTEERK